MHDVFINCLLHQILGKNVKNLQPHTKNINSKKNNKKVTW